MVPDLRFAWGKRPQSKTAEAIIRLVDPRPIHLGGKREPKAGADRNGSSRRYEMRRERRLVDGQSWSELIESAPLQQLVAINSRHRPTAVKILDFDFRQHSP